jgi:predicted nucleotidyltransferase
MEVSRVDAKIQQDLDLIKESVLQAVPAEAIYLFGSYAYGTPDKDSDIDIFVVVPDGTAELSELYADIRGLIRKKKRRMELDLLMGHSSSFNRRKNGPTLERVVAQKGSMLYGL